VRHGLPLRTCLTAQESSRTLKFLRISEANCKLCFKVGFANIANVLGPFIGGSLTQYASWRCCFFINLPCGAFVAGILLITHIPQGIKPEARLATFSQVFHTLDVIGFAIFAPAIIMFLLALSWGGTPGHPWDSATIIGLFLGSAPVFTIFLVWEHHRGATALLPLAMFRQRVVAVATLVQFFALGSAMTTIYYMPVYFQAVRGRSPTIAGAFLVPMVGAQILTAVGGGFLSEWSFIFRKFQKIWY
jgi:MFS family permease